MSVSNGQLANQTTFNGAFLSRTVNTSTVGTVTLNNTSDINSGAQVVNLQRAVNEIFNAVGMTGEGDASRNDYASNNYVANGVSRQVAIGQLDSAFDITTGHHHDGINSKALSAATLADINYFKAEWVQADLIPTAQVDSFNYFQAVGSVDFDLAPEGQYVTLSGLLGYLWYNVTDGSEAPQSDPALGVGTSVQVDILSADDDVAIATKSKAALDAASIAGIDSTAVVSAALLVTYDVGDIPDGDAGNASVVYFVVTDGSGIGGVSGLTTNLNGLFLSSTPNGSTTNAGVATNPPFNRVEIRNLESQTFIEDAEGQKVYGRLTEAAGVWTLTYYTLEAGVETPHSLAAQNISIFYTEVFTLATVPTFGVDAGVIGTLDLTGDIIFSNETVAGKVLLSNVVATAIGSANVKGTATRVSHEDHVHQGIHALQEFSEAVNVFGDIILKGTGGTTVTRSGQTFTINSVPPTNDKAEYILDGTDISNGYVDLTEVALTDSIHFIFYGSGLLSREGVDYTVNYTGGVSSKTRIDFSAHTPALVATDVVLIQYQF